MQNNQKAVCNNSVISLKNAFSLTGDLSKL